MAGDGRTRRGEIRRLARRMGADWLRLMTPPDDLSPALLETFKDAVRRDADALERKANAFAPSSTDRKDE